ncbi:MAG: FIST C-terminal domain-containing protein [Planctomycetota bacterium]|nr:FIST C-terminal domain-containing protein [Planctomycetota bacterium]
MHFRSTLSTERDTDAAVEQVCRALDGLDWDLAIVFTSHHHGPEFDNVLAGISDGISARNLIGCTAESIIGPDREIEQAPAIVVWAARMPGVKILPFCIDQSDLQRFMGSPDWHDRLGVTPDEKPSFVVLPEPFSINVDACLQNIDRAYPGSVVVGGVASGANAAGQNRLFTGDQALRQGLVGVSLCGDVRINSVVSQGCRPIGQPFVVTKSEENVISELGGRPALDVIRDVYHSVGTDDQELIQKGLMLGRVVDEHLEAFGPGDFLIRNVLQIVDGRAIAVNEMIRPGQTVQLHVRDAKAATEDMKSLLGTRVRKMDRSPAGGLLFSCNGRGRRMFDAANHDIGIVNSIVDSCVVAGFFAGGEIGPIGNRTFVHGFTSSLILFSEPV